MSVEFRQRTPGEYAKIVWKRKWLIILPAIAVATAVAWVVYRLPDVYESVYADRRQAVNPSQFGRSHDERR